MKKVAHRTSTSISGQVLYSPRFERKSERSDWLKDMRDARRAIRRGEELTAHHRRLLEQAGFKFEIFEGDIFIEDLAAQFLIHRAKNYVASTASFNLSHIRKYILHHFARRNVYSIKSSEVRRMIEGLTVREFKGYEKIEKAGKVIEDRNRPVYIDTEIKAGPSLKKAVLVTLSQMFEFAKEEEIVSERFQNPAQFSRTRGSRQAKAITSRPFWKRREDAVAWLEAAAKKGPMFYVMGVLGLEGGLRKGELLGLQWRDIDWQQKTITISRQLEQVSGSVVERTKSGSQIKRRIPLTPGMDTALTEWRRRSGRSSQSDFILHGESGRPLSPRSVWQWFAEICEKAGVEDISPHGMRHTYATHFIIAGGRVEDLKQLMGHASISTTMVYVHLVEDMLRSSRPVVSFTTSPDDQKPGKK